MGFGRKHEIEVDCSGFRVPSFGFPVGRLEGWKVGRDVGRGMRTGHRLLPTAYRELGPVHRLLPTVNWGLCTAYCLLPTAYREQGSVHRLLPTAYCGLGPVHRLLPTTCRGLCDEDSNPNSVTYLSKPPIPQLFAIRYSLFAPAYAPTYAKAPVGRIHYSLFTVYCSLFTTSLQLLTFPYVTTDPPPCGRIRRFVILYYGTGFLPIVD